MRRHLLAVSIAVALSGCSSRKIDTVEVAVPMPVPIPPAPTPMPQPPNRAALGLTIPARLSDGSYATPNRAVSASAALWHLRAALNVAALGCPDPTLSAAYNRLLATHRAALAQAHAALTREYGDADRFDAAMTRLYNYFAQPPAQPGFCAEAAAVLREIETTPALDVLAPAALQRLDRPFTEFYAAYDRYREALAAWRAGQAGPRIAYDMSALRASAPGAGRLAAR